MSKNNKKEETPWFVSYPRSGCIWIQAMMEIALDSPRGPNQTGGITWRPPQPGEEFLWNHTHDINLNIKPSETEVGDIFLYRNPIDAIYSLVNGADASRKNIDREATLYRNLMEKWANKAKTHLVFEDTVKDPYVALELACIHFNKPWNQEKVDLAVATCTKENILKKGEETGSRWHNKSLLQEKYISSREDFRKQNGKKILNIVLTPKTEELLENVLNHD